jgi:flagellin
MEDTDMGITRINNNVAALSATRTLNRTGAELSKNIERLSSGLRINRAGDDAAGLTIRERLRTQIRGTDQSIRNAQDGVSMVNTTEAALDSLVASLQRIRVLAIQAGNTGSNDFGAIQAIQDEVFQQIDEVNRIASTARFSTRLLFTGDNSNTTEVKAGQDDIGVRISANPNASNLRSGTSILHIVKTQEGSENILPSKKEDGQAIFATGIKNSTDIAVTTGRFVRDVNLPGERGAITTDALSTLVFDGVSIAANNVIAFQGVLSDGVTPFAGSISVGGNTVSDLMNQVQTAIDNAETALFGGIAANIPASFVQTHVSIPAAGAALTDGSGRLRFLSARAEGTSTTTNADLTDAPSFFQINFKLINSSGNIKTEVNSTRDFVAGQRVGGQYGNHLQAITGSTFDTGNFNIEVTDVLMPNRRRMESTLVFRDSSGAILSRNASLASTNSPAIMNGTFVNGIFTTGDTGISFEANDTLTIQGTNADGTTFQTVFTIVTDPLADRNLADGQIATIGGLIDELNNRDRTLSVNGPTLQSSFRDAVMTLTGKGTLELIDDIADTSQSNFYMIVDDHNSTRTLTDKARMMIEGNAEMATVSIGGGPRQRVRIGDQAELKGVEPTKFGEIQPSLFMRMGAGFRTALDDSIYNMGKDTAVIEQQEFVGSLNGGPKVTFQNGEQNVFFESGVSEGVAETLMLDFDNIIDISGPTTDGSQNTGKVVLLSTVNNALNFQVGPFKGQDLKVNIPDMRSDILGFGKGSGKTVSDINITTVSGVNLALEIIDEALDQVSRTRSTLGAFTNRLETTISSLSVNAENLTASESRLSDIDISTEVSRFTANQLLFQAGTSILSQANNLPQGLLALLQ